MRAETANQNRHNQRTSRQTELHRLRNIHQRHRTEQYTKCNTKENRQQLRLAQFLHRVTQHTSHLLDSGLITHDHHSVAHLQLHTLIRDKINSRTIHTRNVDSVTRTQTQVRELLSVDFGLRDHNSSRYELRMRIRSCAPLLFRHFYLLTQECQHRLLILRR